MKSHHRTPGRWIGLAVGAALVLGACGSASTVAAPTEDVETSPAVLPLEEATSVETEEPADSFTVSEFVSLEDLAGVELTPELFEELKTTEPSRSAVLDEMMVNGLDLDEAVCFLDTVSPGLFITFGIGEQPDDTQFAELLGLLDTCEIAFGAES